MPLSDYLPDPSMPDMGKYMSGGVFSKVLDLMSTGSYLSAGAADAALRGENPLEGAMEGIRDRKSFVDVMKSRGVPNVVATPLGIAGDIFLDPSTLIGGALIKGAKAAQIARLGEVAEHVGEGVRSAEEVARGTGDLAHWDKVAEQAQLMQLGRGKIARDAYKDALPGGEAQARRAARDAAKNYNPSEAQLAALSEDVLSSTKFGPLSQSQSNGFVRGLSYLKAHMVYSMEDYLSKSKELFGNIGATFATHAKKQEVVRQALAAENMRHVRWILKMVGGNKDRQLLFYKAVHGLEPRGSLPGDLAAAFDKWNELAHVRYQDMARAGMKQVHTAMTIAYQRKSPEARQAIAELLQKQGVVKGADYALGTPEWFAQKIMDLGGEVTDAGAVHIPIQEREFYGPLYMKRQFDSAQRTQMDFQNLVAQYMDAEPGLSIAEARRHAEEKVNEIFMAPNDVRRQFQYGRLADNIPVDPKMVEMDPHIWMTKWASDTADRVSQAMVWGGEDQVFKEMQQSLKLQGDRVPGFTGDKELQKIFDLMTGQNQNPLKPVLGAINQAANIFYLGPRTTILQATQLANNAAWTGIADSFAGIVESLTNPKLRQLAEDIGATLPNLFHTADPGKLGQVVSFWHRISGIEWADKQVRIAGAVGAGIRGVETGENLAKAARVGNQQAAAKFARELQMHGIDVGKVLQRGGKLSDDEIKAFMLRGANATNFTNSVMSLQSVFREPGGQFFLKFKNYAAQQSGFIYKLITRAKSGDVQPLLRYAAMFPWTYGMVFKAMNSLRSQPIDTEDDWSMMGNMLMTGALGFWGDSAIALGSSSEAQRLGVVTGPNANLLTSGFAAAVQAAKGDLTGVSQMVPAGVRQARTLITGEQQ